jgi:hypothetical protein
MIQWSLISFIFPKDIPKKALENKLVPFLFQIARKPTKGMIYNNNNNHHLHQEEHTQE